MTRWVLTDYGEVISDPMPRRWGCRQLGSRRRRSCRASSKTGKQGRDKELSSVRAVAPVDCPHGYLDQ